MLIFSRVDCSGGTRDSCGRSGLGETPQERKRRGGSPTVRGKRVFCNENQLQGLTELSIKKIVKTQKLMWFLSIFVFFYKKATNLFLSVLNSYPKLIEISAEI
jgi:hypothetical protein